MREIEVFEKVSKKDRAKWHLYVDAIYKANPDINNFGADVLSKLLSVGVQGGFRYKGKSASPQFVVLFTTGDDLDWRDEFDITTGIFIYYGDQKKPGEDLYKTKLKGNDILKAIFLNAFSSKIEDRKKIPPIFVFKKSKGRDVQFLGLAVPGVIGKPVKEWLVALWGATRDGQRFQNYKSYFTILDTTRGCLAEKNNSRIHLAWLSDVEDGNAYDSPYAPIEWKNYIDNKVYKPLVASIRKYVKSKDEQLPSPTDVVKVKMLNNIHRYFIGLDGGYSFEPFACDILKELDQSVDEIEVTRCSRDGGVDAVGTYNVFLNCSQSVKVEFYMQAKCYKPGKALGVKDTSRLISRIKNRQFGVLVTTSFIGDQAYSEAINDGHPVVFVTGKDIVDLLYERFEIRSEEALDKWLKQKYPSRR